MARIVYALCGEGRGHLSRTQAVAETLRGRGHEIIFCCGGTAKRALEAGAGAKHGKADDLLSVPALGQSVRDNRVDFLETVRRNLHPVLFKPEIVRGLARRLEALEPAVLVTDFEPFSALAAELIGLPTVPLNRQQILTETRPRVPRAHALNAALTAGVVRHIAPQRPAHVILPSFAPASPPRRPTRVSLVPPIIRAAAQAQTPSTGEHIVVYTNHAGAAEMLGALRGLDQPFVLFGFGALGQAEQGGNLTFMPPSEGGFLDALASSRGVICTAGFTLLSEALYLGKPVLAVPNRGSFEQTLNALELTREGLGENVIGRSLTREDVTGFLTRTSAPQQPPFRPGNDAAADIIERVISERGLGKELGESGGRGRRSAPVPNAAYGVSGARR